jgi:CubicO group peptidase (beta-lactamase class C family)
MQASLFRTASVLLLLAAQVTTAQGFIPTPDPDTIPATPIAPDAPGDTKPAPVIPGPTLDQQLKGALTPLLIKTRVPAIAVALFDSDAVLGKAAMGLRAKGQPESVTTADRWHIGSCTKAFTATLVGALVEEGKLKWDTTLAQALPEAAETMHADYKKVTVRQLLRHRAGLAAFTAGNSPDFDLLKNLPGDTRQQRAAFVTKLLSLPPTLPPDTKLFYSNASYAVAAAIIEQASGKPYETLLKDRVFDIVAMPHAGLGWPANPTRRDEPRGHMPGVLGAKPQDFDPKYKLDPVLAPAGDIHCSIEELAMFAAAHMTGLREAAAKPAGALPPPQGQPARLRLLRPSTIVELHTPIDGYAAGWVIDEKREPTRHWHNGSAGTFFTLMVIIPERNLGAVAVCNSGEGEAACAEIIETALGLKP